VDPKRIWICFKLIKGIDIFNSICSKSSRGIVVRSVQTNKRTDEQTRWMNSPRT